MSMTVHALVAMTEGGFVEFCKRQGWKEPHKVGSRLYTCVCPVAMEQMKLSGHTRIPTDSTLWYETNSGMVGFDGDFDKLHQASQRFVAESCWDKANQLRSLERKLQSATYRTGTAAQQERETLSAQIKELKSEIYSSDELLCCEGLSRALTAGMKAEIVLDNGQFMLDVAVEENLQSGSGLTEVVLS